MNTKATDPTIDEIDPTIDEMLDWLWLHYNLSVGTNMEPAVKAICTIFEKVRYLEKLHESAAPLVKRIQLQAVREFVDRVKARSELTFQYTDDLLDELAATEKDLTEED